MCMGGGGGGGKSADQYYQEMAKPEKKPLPSLSMSKIERSRPTYDNVRTGQERRSLILPYGLRDE